MNIRPVKKADCNEIAELIINELGYQEQKREDIFARFDKTNADGNYHMLVAYVDDKVVGFIGLCKFYTYETDGYISILAFAVAEGYRQQGIGKKLLAAAKEYAVENNIKQMRVSSAFHREEAHLFYEANGFERTSYTFIMEI